MSNKQNTSSRLTLIFAITVTTLLFLDNLRFSRSDTIYYPDDNPVVSGNRAQGHNAEITKSHEDKSWVEKAVEPSASLPLIIALVGAMFWLFRYVSEQQQELSRLHFLDVVSKQIDSLYVSNIKPTLNIIEGKLEIISKELTDSKFKHQVLKKDIDEVRSDFEEVKTYITISHGKLEKRLTGTLSQTLESLPCIDKIAMTDDQVFQTIDCQNKSEIKNIFYPRSEQNLGGFD